jgi:hypothetical protein
MKIGLATIEAPSVTTTSPPFTWITNMPLRRSERRSSRHRAVALTKGLPLDVVEYPPVVVVSAQAVQRPALRVVLWLGSLEKHLRHAAILSAENGQGWSDRLPLWMASSSRSRPRHD